MGPATRVRLAVLITLVVSGWQYARSCQHCFFGSLSVQRLHCVLVRPHTCTRGVPVTLVSSVSILMSLYSHSCKWSTHGVALTACFFVGASLREETPPKWC